MNEYHDNDNDNDGVDERHHPLKKWYSSSSNNNNNNNNTISRRLLGQLSIQMQSRVIPNFRSEKSSSSSFRDSSLLSPSTTTSSSSSITSAMTSTMTSTTTSMSSTTLTLLTILPTDIISNEILGKGYISDKTIKRFLQALGEQRVTKLYKLNARFCTKHGSKLEDSNTFQNHTSSTSTTIIKTNGKQSHQQSVVLCCPECYAEEQHLKRCNGCKKFHSQFFFGEKTNNHTTIIDSNTTTDGPGLWCQQCDKMAFCNACLSNGVDGCGANSDDDDTNTTTTITNYCKRRNTFGPGRMTCHNCCCPNVFTSTMCGEFVCHDCGEQHMTSDGNGGDNTVEVCDECGKATCLDPNCYVCANFKSINISCGFLAEDSYKFIGIGHADSITKLRRAVTDMCIYSGFLFILYKIWCGGGNGSSINNVNDVMEVEVEL